jgi:hypothetical protein
LVLEAPHFQVSEGKARPTRHLSDFLTCMALYSPSMMDSLYYELNGGSGMHGFCVFLSFSTVCKYGVMALCDDCEMLVIVSRVMGIIDYKVVHWLFSWSIWFFMMVLCGIMVTVVQ